MRTYERFVDKGCNSLSSMSARLSLLDGSEFQDLGEMMSDPSTDTGSLSATANIETTLHHRRLGQGCPKNGGEKGKRLYRLTTVCLGLLTVLLLTIITALCIHYNRQLNDTMEKHSRLSETLTVLMAERDQLQANYSSLIAEREQLQTNYSHIKEQRDQLQSRLEPPCPEGWQEFQSRLYFFSKEKDTWSESRQYCKDRGGDLVTIKSTEKQVFLNGFMKRNHFWIGLSDRGTEGTWKWVDGTALTKGYWKRGEPNDADSAEDCATSEPETTPLNNWNDMPCGVNRHWVCERSVC
ncbi:hypothetical protein AGOR_G00195370 [Albula goreensis]|uniref:C-type lectin domain-containing protein n=1 Tax=Albula goreensis TaxID=1534307 RepID=A0A8T3CW98_9TELE|nr:hypothetical protein AGOR_G00195370 [Albula goreensis]